MSEQIKGQNSFPAWARVFSFFIGFILIGDGMRRFITPTTMENANSFLTYIFVGAACLLICGYSRRLYVNEEGLIRETDIWGKKRKEVLITWDKIERVIYSEQKKAFTACFEHGNKGYRISVDVKDKDALCELVQIYYKNG